MALRGTLTHRKTRRLARELGIGLPYALGLMEALWHVTGEQAPDGAIGRMTNADLADEMFYGGDAEELVRALIAAGLVDVSAAPHRLIVHDWHEHADDATKTRLLNASRRFANGAIPLITKHSREQRAKHAERYGELPFPPQGGGARVPSVADVATVGNVGNVGNEGPLLPHPEPEPEPEPEPTPLAPKGAKVLAMRNQLLFPVVDPRPDAALWVQCLGIAARWVMAEGALTGRTLERDIGKALEAEMRRRDARGLDELARLAAKNWAEYRAAFAQGRMRWGPWGAKKFYEGAHWLGNGSWPYDETKLAQQRNAQVGLYRGGRQAENVQKPVRL